MIKDYKSWLRRQYISRTEDIYNVPRGEGTFSHFPYWVTQHIVKLEK